MPSRKKDAKCVAPLPRFHLLSRSYTAHFLRSEDVFALAGVSLCGSPSPKRITHRGNWAELALPEVNRRYNFHSGLLFIFNRLEKKVWTEEYRKPLPRRPQNTLDGEFPLVHPEILSPVMFRWYATFKLMANTRGLFLSCLLC